MEILNFQDLMKKYNSKNNLKNWKWIAKSL